MSGIFFQLVKILFHLNRFSFIFHNFAKTFVMKLGQERYLGILKTLIGADMSRKEKKRMFLIGIITGMLNGLFGGGGGMVAVPAFITLIGMEPRKAHATAIALILPVTVISVAVYVYKGYFDFSLVMPVTSGVAAGGVFGAILLKKSSNVVLIKLFAVIMLAAGVKLLFF